MIRPQLQVQRQAYQFPLGLDMGDFTRSLSRRFSAALAVVSLAMATAQTCDCTSMVPEFIQAQVAGNSGNNWIWKMPRSIPNPTVYSENTAPRVTLSSVSCVALPEWPVATCNPWKGGNQLLPRETRSIGQLASMKANFW